MQIEIIKKNGDYEFLWSMVKDHMIENESNFREIINEKFADSGLLNIDIIEDVPLLNIAVPVNVEKWNGVEPIKVGFNPITEEDTSVTSIQAFDGQLNVFELDAKNEPDYPIVIFGINEREGYDSDDGGHSLSKISSNLSYQINHFRLMDDKEPWFKGKPEIYIRINKGRKIHFRKVNKEKTYYSWNHSWLPKQIYVTSYYNDEIFIDVWEDDTRKDDRVETKGWTYSDMFMPKYKPHESPLLYRGVKNNADLNLITVE